MRKLPRLEWISLLYLTLFVLAVMSPSLVRDRLFGLPESRAEELLIFTFGVCGLLTFSAYQRVMERRDREREQAFRDRDRAKQELASSYEYIGAINRQMEALKRIANQTAAGVVQEERVRKDVFQSLAGSAATFVRAKSATIRMIGWEPLRTVREFHADPAHPVRISNKQLLRVHKERLGHAMIKDESGADILVIPSDRQTAPSMAFVLIAAEGTGGEAIDSGILKVCANQAELLHHSMRRGTGTAEDEPMALIAAAESQVIGDVS